MKVYLSLDVIKYYIKTIEQTPAFKAYLATIYMHIFLKNINKVQIDMTLKKNRLK